MSNEIRMTNVLLAEDTDAGIQHFRKLLENCNDLEVEAVRNPAAVERRLAGPLLQDQRPVDCVVTNLVFEGSVDEGISLVFLIRQTFPDLPIIIWTKSPDRDITRALHAGATVGIQKYSPVEEHLLSFIRSLVFK